MEPNQPSCKKEESVPPAPTARKSSLKEILSSLLPDALKSSSTEKCEEPIKAFGTTSGKPFLSNPDQPTLSQIHKQAERRTSGGGPDHTLTITEKLRSLLSSDLLDESTFFVTRSAGKKDDTTPTAPSTAQASALHTTLHDITLYTEQSNAHVTAKSQPTRNEAEKERVHLATRFLQPPGSHTSEPSLFLQAADATGASWSAKDDTCRPPVAETTGSEETKGKK